MDGRELVAFLSFALNSASSAFGPARPLCKAGGRAGGRRTLPGAPSGAPTRLRGNFHSRDLYVLRTRGAARPGGDRVPGPSAHVSTPRSARGGGGRWDRRMQPGRRRRADLPVSPSLVAAKSSPAGPPLPAAASPAPSPSRVPFGRDALPTRSGARPSAQAR